MQDPLDVFNRFTTCTFCQTKFRDVVKCIPDCGEFICGNCYEHLKEGETREYECKACDQVHVLPDIGLADCKKFADLLRHPIEKPLSKQAKQLKLLIENVQQELAELEAFDPRDHIEQHCVQLELEVSQAAESAVKHIHETEKDLLDKIRVYRKQCLDALTADTSGETTATLPPEGSIIKPKAMSFSILRSQIQYFSSRWNDYFKRLNSLACEEELDAAIHQANLFQAEVRMCDQRTRNIALRESAMQFNPGTSFHSVKDHLGELAEIATEVEPTGQSDQVESFSLTGHMDTVWEVVFLPGGQMASCSSDKTVKVWDTSSGSELFTLNGHAAEVYTIAILPNGWLASGSRDMTIKLWSLDEKKEVRTLRGHTGSIASLKVLKYGNLASCSTDDTIKIWDPCLTENNLLLTITGHGNIDSIIAIGVLSNDFLVTHSDDEENAESTLRVWDSKDGRLVKSLSTGLEGIWTLLVLSNDQIAIGTGNGTIKIIDLEDESKTRIKEEAHALVSYLWQLTNGNLVSAGKDEQSSSSPIYSIKVWHLSDFSLLQDINTGHSNNIISLSISTDQTVMASTSDDETIQLWSIGDI